LQDLALVQLVGVIVGTYSSIFFATPLLVAMRERTELVRSHTRRVLNRRKGSSGRALDSDSSSAPVVGSTPVTATVAAAAAPEKPAPGAKPIRPTGRPSGKRNARR
jgi:preprotein translocase subunit SecF